MRTQNQTNREQTSHRSSSNRRDEKLPSLIAARSNKCDHKYAKHKLIDNNIWEKIELLTRTKSVERSSAEHSKETANTYTSSAVHLSDTSSAVHLSDTHSKSTSQTNGGHTAATPTTGTEVWDYESVITITDTLVESTIHEHASRAKPPGVVQVEVEVERKPDDPIVEVSRTDVRELEAATGTGELKDRVSKEFVSGTLEKSLATWRRTCQDKYILDVIEMGYKLPFRTMPQGTFLKNNKSALKNPAFVRDEILELLNRGCIRETDQIPFVVNPLSVAQNESSKKLRLVLDLRHVNPHLQKFATKFEGLEVLKQFLAKNSYLVSFDLKSGYHHINIRSEHQKFLGFAWEYLSLIHI